MPTICDLILEFIREHPGGVDDDQIASDLGLKYRQQVNACCRKLAKEGLINRRKVSGKLHNYPIRNNSSVPGVRNSFPAESDKIKGPELGFVQHVKSIIQKILSPKYIAEQGANLYYQITIDNNLNVTVDPKKPLRGQSAFQTDLCVFEKRDGIILPRVVIECKSKITTHDVITYSNKARRHKQVYPYLRYGMISFQISRIPKRFLVHNEGLDFYLTVGQYSGQLETVLEKLLNEELQMSRVLESAIFGNVNHDFYQNTIQFKNIGRLV